MTGGTGVSLVCGRKWPRRRMAEYQKALNCSRGWKRQLKMNVGRR